ncbi:MAG: polyprenyl synthetase family protein [Alphaproteobacteria bacterium]|nr:polyprenyl synthetase family protein [Alphaproteobacteria bacterium]MCB9697177.1 polyprenyl synthetase family protein [Alphaproteobacteria bacterium]
MSVDRRQLVDQALAGAVAGAWPERFAEALRYPIETGGKRVRPLLVLAAHEAVSDGAGPEPALHAAAAIELVHTYSLVHDDLPCMDDDDERRGRPTAHVVFGEAAAVLVGDGLLTRAFEVLTRAPLPPAAIVACVAALSRAAGFEGMVAGQAADIGMGGQVSELDALTRLHAGKTGALLQCAAVLGGICAGASADQRAALERYGASVGLAFQLWDDVLDADEDAGDDGPPSFVRLLGVEETQRRARAMVEDAIAAVAALPRPEPLVALARSVVDRAI